MMGYIKSTYGSPAAAWQFHLAHNAYDKGGIADGMGWMPKKTLKPERVLSPQQTKSFDRMVDAISGKVSGSAPRKMVITGGNVSLDGNGNLVIRHLAAEEARAEIAFAQRGK
jgi:hypothetical protein